MQGIKYILFLFLCGDGWVCNKFGMGPGLDSMSPHFKSRRCDVNICILKLVFFCLTFVCCVLVFLLLFCGLDVLFVLVCFFLFLFRCLNFL